MPAANAASLPDPSLPEGTDTLPQIRHIVVLMMENHSYDNYLGMLDKGEGFPKNANGDPTSTNPDRRGTPVPAHHFSSTVQQRGVPTQSWNASHIQWNDGANDGFVRSIEETVSGNKDASVAMGYWTGADMPFYYWLADTFALADHWFGSCLGPTFPNRRFLMAGTANGLIDDLPTGLFDYPKSGTLFDLLDRHGVSWVNYHHTSKAKAVFKRLLGGRVLSLIRKIEHLFLSFVPKVQKALQRNIQFTTDLYPLGLLRSINHLRDIRQFWVDAAAGTLPAVCIVDPDYSTGSEENPQDIHRGERFAAKVVQAVMAGDGWPNTLLVWVYDEHGGYYDHVAPPAAVEPDDVRGKSLLDAPSLVRRVLQLLGVWKRLEAIDAGPTRYDRLGFRVPAVVVSPFARPGHVSSTVYDHTSILKLIERKWNLPPLTRRDAAASDFLDMLDLDAPPAFLRPPPLVPPAPVRS